MDQATIINTKTQKRKNKNKNIPDDKDRCKGIKHNGERCTRRHMFDIDYCKSHSINHSNANTKNKANSSNTNQVTKNKRGRKPKYIIDEKLNNDEYIPVLPILINGTKYYIDFNNNVFSYDIEKPLFLGVKTIYGIDNTIEFIE